MRPAYGRHALERSLLGPSHAGPQPFSSDILCYRARSARSAISAKPIPPGLPRRRSRGGPQTPATGDGRPTSSSGLGLRSLVVQQRSRFRSGFGHRGAACRRRQLAQWYGETMLATIDSGGRVAVPKDVRERLGLRPGSRVVLTEVEGHLEISPVTTPVRLVDDGGIITAFYRWRNPARRHGREGQSQSHGAGSMREARCAAISSMVLAWASVR